jgi:putative PIN family toxin of toxin-antitoxin system
MKIVLDANVFVSSFFWGGKPRLVLERAIAQLDELYISEEILEEISGVIGRPKFHTGRDKIEYYIKSIKDIGNMVSAKEKIKNGSRDKTDNKYLECGLAGSVDYIISGDIHLLEIKEYGKIKIVTANEYLEMLKSTTPP